MTDNSFQMVPPPELVEKWADEHFRNSGWIDAAGDTSGVRRAIATQAARWGADQELEACINYFHEYDPSWGEASELITGLRAARRPKSPTLKEEALKALDDISIASFEQDAASTIRRALEQLDD